MNNEDDSDDEEVEERRNLRAYLNDLKNSFRYDYNETESTEESQVETTRHQSPLDRLYHFVINNFDLDPSRFDLSIILVVVALLFFLVALLSGLNSSHDNETNSFNLILARSKNIVFDL